MIRSLWASANSSIGCAEHGAPEHGGIRIVAEFDAEGRLIRAGYEHSDGVYRSRCPVNNTAALPTLQDGDWRPFGGASDLAALRRGGGSDADYCRAAGL